MSYRLIQTGSCIKLLQNGNEIKTFDLRDDLEYSLDLLRRLNTTRDDTGVELSEVEKVENYSVWAFGQHNVFWGEIRPFVQFKSVLDFLLHESIIPEVEVSYPYHQLLVAAGLANEPVKRFRRWLLSMHQACFRVLARIVTEYAFLKLRIKNTKYLIYTPDKFHEKSLSDFRFASVYDFLRKERVEFMEVFHTQLDKNFFRNLIRRHRPAIYLEALKHPVDNYFKSCNFNLEEFSSVEKILARKVIKDFSVWGPDSVTLVKALESKLGKTKARVLIGIDDPRNTNELIIALRRLGGSSYGIQHGHFTKYLVGWMNPSISPDVSVAFDKLYVWNKYWKKVLLDYSTQYGNINVEIGGVLRRPKDMELSRTPEAISLKDLSILIPEEPWAPKSEVGGFINDLLKLGVTIYQSVRPDTKGNPLDAYKLDDSSKIKLVGDMDANLLSKIHAVCGTYSTFLNDMMYYGKPVILFDTSFTHGHRLLEDNLVLRLKRGNYQSIIPYISTHTSKRDIVWPSAPPIEETLRSLLTQV